MCRRKATTILRLRSIARWTSAAWFGWQIGNEATLLPFGYSLGVDAVARGKRSQMGAVDKAWDAVSVSFDRFCLTAGIEALGTKMEQDAEQACGHRTLRRLQWRTLALEIRTERQQEACRRRRKHNGQRHGGRGSRCTLWARDRLHHRRPGRAVPTQRAARARSRRLVADHGGSLSLLPGPAAAPGRIACVHRHDQAAQRQGPLFTQVPVLTSYAPLFRRSALQSRQGGNCGGHDEI